MHAVRRWGIVYGAILLTGAILFSVLLRRDAAPWGWIAFWISGFLLAGAAPVRPVLGLGAYAATLYGTPRYSELFDQLLRSNLLHAETLLVALGSALWVRRQGHSWRSGSFLLWLALALGVWIGVSVLIPRVDVVRSVYAPRHSPVFFVHALVLLVAASHVMNRPSSQRELVIPLCVGLAARSLWQGSDGLRLEGDIGPLAVMTLPLAVLLVRSEPTPTVKALMSALVVGCFAVVGLTYNRAAAVALAVTLALLVWQFRRQRWLLALVILAVLGSGLWLAKSPYLDRFQAAWSELTGSGSGSVTERLALWRAGFAIVADRPVSGVGLGNYSGTLASYEPQLRGLVAHNSYVHIAAETGVPGLLLYLTLCVAAVIGAGLHARRHRGHWSSSTALAVQASLIAYLTVGLFISRHDMVLAYVLIGWVAALVGLAGPRDIRRSA